MDSTHVHRHTEGPPESHAFQTPLDRRDLSHSTIPSRRLYRKSTATLIRPPISLIKLPTCQLFFSRACSLSLSNVCSVLHRKSYLNRQSYARSSETSHWPNTSAACAPPCLRSVCVCAMPCACVWVCVGGGRGELGGGACSGREAAHDILATVASVIQKQENTCTRTCTYTFAHPHPPPHTRQGTQ
jgi:hypothetical protein